MRCNYCGTNVPDGSAFCPNCGGRVDITPQQNNAGRNGYNPPPNPYPPQQDNEQNQEGFTLSPDFFEIPPIPSTNNPQPTDAKKKKNKGLLIALAIVIIVALLAGLGIFLFLFSDDGESATGTSGYDSSTSQSDSAVQEVDPPASGSVTAQPTFQEETTDSGSISIEQQVIYNKDSIKITVTALETDSYYTSLCLLTENNSQKNIRITSENSSINGLMFYSSCYINVSPGKKSNDKILFHTKDLKGANITAIKDIEFTLVLSDPDTYQEIDTSDIIKISIPGNENYVQTYDDSGIVAYEDSNIKIVAKKVSASDEQPCSNVSFYIENNTGKDIHLSANNVSVNGYMVGSLYFPNIRADRRLLDSGAFYDTDLTKNSITDIEEIELSFEIRDEKTYDTIIETEPISIKF